MNVDKYEEAMASIEKASELDPENEFYQSTKGYIFIYMGRFAECIDACNLALKINPNFKTALDLKSIGEKYTDKED